MEDNLVLYLNTTFTFYLLMLVCSLPYILEDSYTTLYTAQ